MAHARSSFFAATALGLGAALLIAPTTARAEGDDDDDAPAATPAAPAPKRAEFGLALRVRNVRLPEKLLELKVDDAPGGLSQVGFGLELARRRGNFELQLGVEYDPLKIDPGIWIEKDKPIPQNEPDFVEFDGFGWVTLEVNFINHTELAKNFYLRYGGGIGLGILLGDIVRTDYVCTTSDPDSCVENVAGANKKTPYDLFTPVFPTITGLVGVQYRPGGNLAINLEGGIRTLPFWGGSIGYYF